jgi:hypothetical protein
MDLTDFRLAPINRKADFVEKLAGVSLGTYDVFSGIVARIGVEDHRVFSERGLEIEIRDQFNQMRSDPELRALHDFSNNWFGAPTRATLALLWTWGAIVRPDEIVEGEEFDSLRCAQLLYAQEIALPAGVTLAETGGLEWAPRAALAIGQSTNILRTNDRDHNALYH